MKHKVKIEKLITCALTAAVTCSSLIFASSTTDNQLINSGRDNVKPAEMISLPGVESITADYVYSNVNYRGEVIDHFKDADGNEYTKNPDGTLRTVIFSNNTSVNLVKASPVSEVNNDSLKASVRDLVNGMTKHPENYEETLFIRHGSGSEIYYDIIFSEKICGFKTENSVSASVERDGTISSFTVIDNVDYSGVNTETLAAISGSALTEYVDGQMNILFGGTVESEINDVYLLNTNGTYSLHITVEYTSEEADANGRTGSTVKVQELYYDVN